MNRPHRPYVDMTGKLYRSGLWRPDHSIAHDALHHVLLFILPAAVLGATLGAATTWWLGALIAGAVTVASGLGE